MIVMPANVTSPEVRALVAEFPGRVGNLFSPGAWQSPITTYALDNGRYSAVDANWSELEWHKLIGKAQAFRYPPEWILCPDVVRDWGATVRDWALWSPRLRRLGWDLALAVQDGATIEQVQQMAPDVVFVGGSTAWKWKTVEAWAATFPRVHVGRVNSMRRAWECSHMGVESVDGTGWMRTTRQRKQFRTLLGQLTGRRESQLLLLPYAERLQHGPDDSQDI